MSNDRFTEVTSQSWFDRIRDSIKGVIFGLILLVIAFPLLFWNEGHAVQTARTLEEGAGLVVSVAADRVDSANDRKLVHMTGEATTGEVLGDPSFGISVNAIKLTRSVEVYQWKETQTTEEKTKVGGGTERTTTYSYSQTWSGKLIDSNYFKKPEGHTNPSSKRFEDNHYVAQKVTLGAFTLSPGLLAQLNQFTPLPVNEETRSKLPPDLRDRLKTHDGMYYWGENPLSPQTGDMRIQFTVVKPATVSIIARQASSTFEPYLTKAGGSIEMLKVGTYSAEAMFQAATAQNEMLTWFLRAIGFLLLFFGLFLVFRPLAVLADILPFLGSLLRLGIGLCAGILAITLALVTIAFAWLFYRPWFSIPLLLVAAGAVCGLWWLGKQKRAQTSLEPARQRAASSIKPKRRPPPPPKTKASSEAAPVAKSKFCTKCGAPVAAGAKFCNKCGKKLR